MNRQRVERRLAAILAADVVGYSRLMSTDEAGTLGRLKALRREFLDPKTAEHGGRIVKLMGDGALVEFPSVVDAVQCAVEIQRGMVARNADVPEDRRIEFRIGINLGDVIIEDGDIYGDGVNIAARLEALAEPGGVCVSRTVFDHVRGKVHLAFDDLGEQRVKNIAEPVQVYRVLLDDQPPEPSTAAIGTAATRSSARPSIAVLLFTNMSGDPEQEYFSDGITEDLITDLSKIAGLLVIARHSSFAYKGRVSSARKIAEELGVRYIVEGSVRRSGKRIRINAQLIDAVTDAHLWAERYDRDVEDIFAVQDEVVAEIVDVLKLTLGKIDIAGGERPANLEAHDCLLRGRDLCQRFTAEDNARAKEWLDKAVQLDPNYAQAHLWLAFCHWVEYQSSWSDANSLELAAREASRAVELDPREPLARAILGLAYLYKRELTQSIREYEEALRLQPNQPDVLVFVADALIMDGRPLEGIKCVERAIRLNPHHPDIYLWGLAFGQYAARRYEDSSASILRMASPGTARRILAASLAQLGRIEEARDEAARFLQGNPEFSARAWGRTQPFRHDADRQHFIGGYLKAGLPE